ncbi:hypothetical protein D3C72_1333290 [compost metagenome]
MSPVSVSSSSSTAPTLSKKLVGGIWRLSPTTTTRLPRSSAPKASTGLTCEASSKMTRSKFTLPGGRKLAIESGLIIKTGLMAWTAEPARSISRRIGRWRVFFSNSLVRTPSCPPASVRGKASQCAEASLARWKAKVSRSNSWKRAIAWRCPSPSKCKSAGRSR